MRTRRNDTVGDPTAPEQDGPEQDGPEQDGPLRSCILTRDRASRAALVRLALAPDGQVLPDVRAKAPGRGAWIGVTRPELDAAIAKGRLKGALARAFKGAPFTLAPDLSERIAAALQRNALDRLGLEAKSGTLLTGAERIETAARGGQLHALYHAADASPDGAAKLAQAWRVGTDREGEGVRGLQLPVPRAILSMALGRENVVHLGVTDRAAAGRVGDALDRWLHFIGPDPLPPAQRSAASVGNQTEPCGTAPQGASAPGTPSGEAGRVLNEDIE